MEAIGLAVGIAGLAGLFSTCLDLIDKANSYRDYGPESRSVVAQFEADKLLFRRWAQSVGIEEGNLKNNNHSALDNPATALVVLKILSSIQETFNKTESALLNMQHVSTADPSSKSFDYTQGSSQTVESKVSTSKRHKIGWALMGKAKFIQQVLQFGALVQRLNSLTSVDHLKESDVANPRDFSKSQSILSEALKLIEGQIAVEIKIEIETWLDGTCDWILSSPSFLEWVSSEFPSDSSKVLWVNGPAGYGKTTICARVVEHLSTILKSPLAYYFFSADFESRGDPFVVIRSWIAQLVACNRTAFEIAYEEWQAKDGHVASRTAIMNLFKLIVSSLPNCTFVLDGLDECAWLEANPMATDGDGRTGFLTSLIDTIAKTTTRIMVVSRDEADIRSGIYSIHPSQGVYEHKISPADVQSDVSLFSKSIVNKKLKNKDEMVRNNLSQRIVDRSNGMFLWVKMQEGNLRGGKSILQLQETIDETPTGLSHLYDRNWKKIIGLQQSDRTRALSILRWAAFAIRPLTVLEITEALLVMDDDSYDNILVNGLPDEIDEEYINSEIKGLCESLVETRGASTKGSFASMTVHLAHFSVKQYLLHNMPTSSLLGNNISLQSSEAIQCNELAKTCLRYINFRDIWQQRVCSKDSVDSRPFRDYAATSWHRHLFPAGKNYTDVLSLVNRLFHPENINWQSWAAWFDSVEPSMPTKDLNETRSMSPLYYVSLLGIYDAVVYLTKELKLDLNDVGVRHRTPLYAASWKGNIDVVKVLLELGADVTVADSNGETPLYVASHNGHVDVVKVLLEHGADVTVANISGWTPLNAASSYGHVDVVRVLLEYGADVTVANSNGLTPLYSASVDGYVDVVKVLLEYGADVTVAMDNGWTLTNQEYGNILEYAVHNAKASLVQLLLEVDTDTNLSSDDYGQALQLGCINGNVPIVDALICAGADPNRVDEHGWTSLWCASQFEQDVIMERLVASGGDPSLATRNSTLAPTSWSLVDKSPRLVLNEDAITIRYGYASTEGNGQVNAAAARANHPISLQNAPFYFEITVLDSGDTGAIGLGLCSGYTPINAMPGWNLSSWGYHGDDGYIYNSLDTGEPYADVFGTGDVIGCCLTCDNEITFTKNGISLGSAMKATAGKLYPVIGMRSCGACIRVNFGNEPFQCDFALI
ncbi:hypothetical protein VE04_07004 [Pseudogymnoascus sp. 24MN13]|nr:hypothetical protein VE04_07004 [Pseudogymnoascus sp. 24MN13]